MSKHIPEPDFIISFICDVQIRQDITKFVLQMQDAGFHQQHDGRGRKQLRNGSAVKDIICLKRSASGIIPITAHAKEFCRRSLRLVLARAAD